MFNVELGTKIYNFITAHPERHYQKDWVESSDDECGTTACVAGWACVMGMDLPLLRDTRERWNEDTQKYEIVPGPFYWAEPSGGWEDNAALELNISAAMAQELFRNTTNKEAKEALGLLIAGDPEDEVIRFIRSGDGLGNSCSCGCEDDDSLYEPDFYQEY